MFDLTGKTALVTGSGRGLGFEMAKGLAGAGAHVLVNGRDEVNAAAAVTRIQESGGSAEALVFDVAKNEQRLAALASIESAPGRLRMATPANNTAVSSTKVESGYSGSAGSTVTTSPQASSAAM